MGSQALTVGHGEGDTLMCPHHGATMPTLPNRPVRPARERDPAPQVMVDVTGQPEGAAKDVQSAILKALESQAAGKLARADFRLKFGLVTADGKEY